MEALKLMTTTICMFLATTIGNAQINPEQKKEIEEMQNAQNLSIPESPNMANNALKIQEDMNRLKKETPLSNDELKEWLPETLNGLPRKSFKVGNEEGGMNVTTAQASYMTPNQSEFITNNTGGEELNPMRKSISVEVIDGAGQAGSTVLAPMIFMTSMNFESEDARGHQKTIELDGIIAQQKYTKQNSGTSISFVYEGRFGVTISTAQLNPEETRALIKLLDLNALTLKANKN